MGATHPHEKPLVELALMLRVQPSHFNGKELMQVLPISCLKRSRLAAFARLAQRPCDWKPFTPIGNERSPDSTCIAQNGWK